MTLALECDYCDDSGELQSNTIRQHQQPTTDVELEAPASISCERDYPAQHRKSMAPTPYPISNHDRICSKRISVFDSDDLVIPIRRGERFSVAYV
jgi:hypothetical protein